MTEDDEAGRRTAARAHVSPARSVAGLTLQSTVTKGTAWIVRPRVFGAKDTDDGGIVVAAETGIGARWAVGGSVGRGRRCGLGIGGISRSRAGRYRSGGAYHAKHEHAPGRGACAVSRCWAHGAHAAAFDHGLLLVQSQIVHDLDVSQPTRAVADNTGLGGRHVAIGIF